MKLTPMTTQGAVPVNASEGRSAGLDRLARAKQVASGITVTERPDLNPADPEVQAQIAQNNIKRLKMKTNMSTNRHEAAPVESNPVVEEPKVDTLDNTEQATAGSEETKPLSPQIAALAKAKRALQLERAAFEAEKQSLANAPDTKSGMYTKDQIKSNALSILREAGVTNDELTEAVLRESQDLGPGYDRLQAEVQAVKKALEEQNERLANGEKTQKSQVLRQMTKDAEAIVAQGDDFELVRESGYVPKAIDLIERVFDDTGDVMDVTEALTLIETELLNDSLKFANLKKVRAKLSPQEVEQQQQAVKQDGNKTLKTLTNRDGSSSVSMGRRERAIAAMEGRLK